MAAKAWIGVMEEEGGQFPVCLKPGENEGVAQGEAPEGDVKKEKEGIYR